jgi:ubiquinone/menaquinone biosynthesis C-methylase UbiE
MLATVLLLSILTASSQTPEGDRRDAAEFDRIAALLELRPGSSVADVGAGGGAWTSRLAGHVGTDGRVYATEVKPELVRSLEHLARVRKLPQVRVIAGTEEDTGLPAACCDAILLRLVYHAFDDPPRMIASLNQALKPGGRLLIIDFRPKPDALTAALGQAGFEPVTLVEKGWSWHPSVFAALYRRP